MDRQRRGDATAARQPDKLLFRCYLHSDYRAASHRLPELRAKESRRTAGIVCGSGEFTSSTQPLSVTGWRTLAVASPSRLQDRFSRLAENSNPGPAP
jgi:hypothetical protein